MSLTILPAVTAGAILTVATQADLPSDPQIGWIRYVIDEDRNYTFDGAVWDAGSGDVIGPASATDNAVARFNGTGGTSIQDSVVTIADTSGNTAGVGTLGLSGPITDASLTASRALVSDGAKAIVASATTATEIGHVSGVTSAIQTQIDSKQATGNYVTALTGDVTAAGPGSVAATVAAVGGSTASLVHDAELLANAATDANTASAIVKRDGSGNFTAGTITAALTGNVTGNVTGSSGSCTGNAATVTTNANLTGDVTSVGNATAIASGVIVNDDVHASAAIAGSKLVAASSGVAGAVSATTQTITGIKTFETQAIIKGTATNDSAATGYVGEYLYQTRALSAPTALTTATAKNVTASPLTLTAGDWDIGASVGFDMGAATTWTSVRCSISLTSNTEAPGDSYAGGSTTGEFSVSLAQASAATPASGNVLVIPSHRVSLAAGDDFYLVAHSNFAVSTNSVYGTIWARRVR